MLFNLWLSYFGGSAIFMLLDTRFNALTHQLIGCAMAVHRMLGNGFPEVIYQRSLAIELADAGLSFTEK